MYAATYQPVKPGRQIEDDLREDVRQKRVEWLAASESQRLAARLRFIHALDVFNGFVLRGKIPGD